MAMLRGTLRRDRGWIALGLIALLVLALAPALMPPFYVRVGQQLLFSAGLGLAWAILGGLAGYWSFGHTAFIGLGAFAAGLFETKVGLASNGLSFALGLLIGTGACALVAGLLAFPILRLRGIYFAIAMLGVSQVLSELTNNVDMFEGSMGLILPQLAPAGLNPETFFYYLFLAVTALTLVIAYVVKASRFGYGLLSIREDEDTARMLGVPTERYKRIAFVVSAVLTGMMGVIYAHSLGYITTESMYRDDTNLSLIVYSLLGGMGTLFGPVIGAALLVFVTQVVLARLLDFHLFATGLLLVLLVLAAPGGVIGLARTFSLKRRAAP